MESKVMKRVLLVVAACIVPVLFFAVVWQTIRYHMLVASIRALEVKQVQLVENIYMQEINTGIATSRRRVEELVLKSGIYSILNPTQIIRIVPSVKQKNDG